MELPGRGSASPVIHGGKIFILSAEPHSEAPTTEPPPKPVEAADGGPPTLPPAKQRYEVLAYSTQNGELVWRRTAIERLPHEGHHPDASHASASPVTDGKRLIAHFGSSGTFAYDLQGNLLWQVDLGDMMTRRGFGEGSSPALDGDTVVINWDHEGESFIVALDAETGKTRWRVERPGEMTSWSTPIVVEHGGRKQVIVSATGKSRGYDLATGKELWSLSGMTQNVIPSPVYHDGVVYLTSGFRGSMLQAVVLDRAKGALEGTDAVLWTLERETPYVASPVLHGGQLYFFKVFSDIFTTVDARTGAVHYTERLPGIEKVYASPVAAAGRIYIFDRSGHAAVVAHGPTFEVVAQNQLDEGADASPAIVGDEIFLRTTHHLYCLSEMGTGEVERR